MGFFDSFQQWAGENRAKRLRPIEKMRRELDAVEAEKALQKVIALEQQRSQAENPQIPLQPQQWGIPEQLSLYSAYGQANIDPKDRAEAQIARQKANIFNAELEKIQNPAARINIAQGKEYKPVDIKGGTVFNPYDTENWFIGSTPESLATIGKTGAETGKIKEQTRLEQTKADSAELRLNTVKNLLENPEIHPLLAADIAQDKSVFKGERVKVDDGKGNLTEVYATLTPSGLMKGSPITDKTTGASLKIPTESKDESTKLQQARELVKYGRAKNLKEALTILTSTLIDAPAKAWSKIVSENSKKDFMGSQPTKEEILSNSITQWTMGRRGEPFPVNIVDTINESPMSEDKKQELLATVDKYNQAIIRTNKPQPIPAPTEPQLQPEEPPLSANLSPPAIPQASTQPQPAPTPKRPLTPEAINTAFNSIQQGADTTEVQAKLTEAGFDLSHESVGLMAIDAVNTGIPSDVMKKYLAAIGIKWDTPKG